MTCYGYVRVSSKDQSEARQLDALKAFDIEKKNIFIDRMSGKDFQRPEYKKMMRRIGKDDLIVILSIDRLGRNYREIQNQWQIITREKQADIVVIDMPLLDTRNKGNGDLTGIFISDLVLQILAYVAQIERENIKQRQKEGIQAAKTRGIKFGRPQIEKPDNLNHILEKWRNSEINSRQAAKMLGVSQKTFLKWSHEKSHKYQNI